MVIYILETTNSWPKKKNKDFLNRAQVESMVKPVKESGVGQGGFELASNGGKPNGEALEEEWRRWAGGE